MSVTRATLGASAPVAESSGSIPGSATLAGASAAIAEMLRDVDDLSDSALLGLAVEARDECARHQRKTNLWTILSDESVSGPRKTPPRQQWKADKRTALLVQAASVCSKAVYQKTAQLVPEMTGHSVKDLFWAKPTWDGAGKAAALFQIEEAGPTSQQETIIVVAVRGSGSTVDWIVNLDKNPGSYPDLLRVPNSTISAPLVHRGFAECARTLLPVFRDQLREALGKLQGRKVQILFTGHSAGAAVAALLFCHFLTNGLPGSNLQSGKPLLSCITFGAPPMLSTNITPLLETAFSETVGVLLSFVIEGDPIPRMDGPYANKLAGLYGQVGGSTCVTAEEVGQFKPPPLSLHVVGRLVMLFDKEQESEGIELKARLIDHDFLGKCVWGNFFRHDMIRYLEYTAMIAEGCFNGQRDWEKKRWWKS